jgi:hypothetical protein
LKEVTEDAQWLKTRGYLAHAETVRVGTGRMQSQWKSLSEDSGSWDDDVRSKIQRVSGIQRSAAVFQLENADPSFLIPFDVMHNAFEGVLKDMIHDLLRFFRQGTKQGREVTFTADTLNAAITRFPWTAEDGANRLPKAFKESFFSNEDKRMKCSAMQLWTFACVFPLMFGHLLTDAMRKSTLWKAFIAELRFVQALMEHEVQEAQLKQVYEMGLLAHKLWKQHVLADESNRGTSAKRFKPKHHYLHHHTVEDIMYFGPSRTCATTRFEAKNRCATVLANNLNWHDDSRQILYMHEMQAVVADYFSSADPSRSKDTTEIDFVRDASMLSHHEMRMLRELFGYTGETSFTKARLVAVNGVRLGANEFVLLRDGKFAAVRGFAIRIDESGRVAGRLPSEHGVILQIVTVNPELSPVYNGFKIVGQSQTIEIFRMEAIHCPCRASELLPGSGRYVSPIRQSALLPQ